MLTPAFELFQDDMFLTVIIKAPFAKVSEAEIFIEDTEFKFYSKPYYLRLTLPGRVVEDGREKAQYDADSSKFTIQVPKAKCGEHFEGLDMLTKLLAPSGRTSAAAPIIEVLDSSNDGASASNDIDGSTDGKQNEGVGEEGEEKEEEEEFDWQIEQEPYKEPDGVLLKDCPKYGFSNQRSAVFQRLQSELHDIIDLPDADVNPASRRRELRVSDEEAKFDDDYYLSDLYQNENIKELLRYKPPWHEEYKQIQAGVKAGDVVHFTDAEKEKMRKLPRKEYLLDQKEVHGVFLSLVDIIFAYAYNHRTTEGENTVESGWTISKLSSTMSWLETFTNVKDVVVASYRRCLCYPLYRHWKLARKVFGDVVKIFYIGRRCILKCLLEIHTILSESDPRYILNDLYLTDYCVWIQSVRSKQLQSLANTLSKIEVAKTDVGFDLEVLEVAASLAVEEDQQTNQITAQVAAMAVSQSDKTVISASHGSDTLKSSSTDQDMPVCHKLSSQNGQDCYNQAPKPSDGPDNVSTTVGELGVCGNCNCEAEENHRENQHACPAQIDSMLEKHKMDNLECETVGKTDVITFEDGENSDSSSTTNSDDTSNLDDSGDSSDNTDEHSPCQDVS